MFPEYEKPEVFLYSTMTDSRESGVTQTFPAAWKLERGRDFPFLLEALQKRKKKKKNLDFVAIQRSHSSGKNNGCKQGASGDLSHGR